MDRSSENDGKQNYARWAGLAPDRNIRGVVGLFCYMGYKLDEAFKTSPAFLLGGFFVGFIGMLYPRQKHSGAGPQYPGQIGQRQPPTETFGGK